MGKKRESRREKRSGEQRREKAAESHIQTATGDGECTSHFCWRHFIFRYWHAPVSFICFVCFVILQKFGIMFTLRIPECFLFHIADYFYAFRSLLSLCYFFVSFVVTVDGFYVSECWFLDGIF